MHFTTVRSKHALRRQDTTTVKPSLGQTDHVLMPKPVCAHEISVFPPITPNAPHRAQRWDLLIQAHPVSSTCTDVSVRSAAAILSVTLTAGGAGGAA